uniref:Uncharacterized protein n=1 Tax=Arundo donax TaxID=35708 RepID=A0A0A9HFN5_ARUDO
MAAIRYPTKPP